MSFFSKGTLRKLFAAAVMLTASGLVPTPMTQSAAAGPMTTINAATTVNNGAAAVAAARRARENREATNDVIVAPTGANISRLEKRGVVDKTTAPYIDEMVAEMKIPSGTKAKDITQAQRDQFLTGLKSKRLVAEMSSTTAEEAVAKGMPKSLAPYFMETKAESGYSDAVTLPQAKELEAAMKARHWKNDTKPMLEKVSAIGGTVVVVGGIGYAVAASKRRQSSYDNY
ncbi:MAG: hypothetical protein ACAH83_15060 [Alphaproteobacteria bacterium]